MIKFELKKLFCKQYALYLIIVLVVLKLFSSAELFKPDSGSLSPRQREVYLDYIEQYGGVLTDEKEAAILEKYALLTEAKRQVREIQNKLNGGEFATADEYFKALSEVPEIISDEAAIEKLYSSYESVAKDREHRVLLAFDTSAMTVGQEYWMLIFICYISAISVYYERKIKNLQKASKNGTKTYAAKLFAVFTAIMAVWLIFSAVEFSALTSVISKADLSAYLASLESFKETPYSDMTILGGFFAIEAVKLVGYLFTAAVTLITARLSGDLVLSIFTPAAVNVVWIYLFSNNTAAFYQPFSLMRGAPYLTGTHYISMGDGEYYPEYSEIPGSVFATLIVIAVTVIIIACAVVISAGKNKLNKGKKLPLAVGLTTLTMLTGCAGKKTELESVPEFSDSPFSTTSATTSEPREDNYEELFGKYQSGGIRFDNYSINGNSAIEYNGGEIELSFDMNTNGNKYDAESGFMAFINGVPQKLSLNGGESGELVRVLMQPDKSEKATLSFTPTIPEELKNEKTLQLKYINIFHPSYKPAGSLTGFGNAHIGQPFCEFDITVNSPLNVSESALEPINGECESVLITDGAAKQYGINKPGENSVTTVSVKDAQTKEEPLPLRGGKLDAELLIYGSETYNYRVYVYVNHERVRFNGGDYLELAAKSGYAAIFGIMDLDGNVISETKVASNGSGGFRLKKAGDKIVFMSPQFVSIYGVSDLNFMDGILIYDCKTGEQKMLIPEDQNEISYCDVTPDGKHIVTGIEVWDEENFLQTADILKLYDTDTLELLDTKTLGGKDGIDMCVLMTE